MRMRNKCAVIILIIYSLSACKETDRKLQQLPGGQYAQGFSVVRNGGITSLTIRDPWEKARNIGITYLLADREMDLPEAQKGQQIIRTPVQRIVCMSSSHIAFLDALGELNKITGISGSRYISNPAVKENINSGKIRDVGYGHNLNYEEIIRQQPDLVMLYGVDREITGTVEKLEDLGISAVLNAEYLESDPLGKAEWIRFVACFFNREAKADSLFRATESRYKKLAGMALAAKSSPRVMVGLPFRDSWWIPGGKSYLAQLIADAGGKYVADSDSSHESFVISLEEAFLLSSEADIWINVGNVKSREEILMEDSRFSSFPLYKKGRIYNNNRISTPAGGNDFWESGTLHPDMVLSDLIRIFHPELLPADTLTYYREIL